MSKLLSIALMVAAGCTVGAPPGFSGGDRWTFPLVGPLEDGVLVTPVSVRGHGPYLFAFDPDANVTAIDQQVAQEAGLLVGSGPRRIDEAELGRNRFYAELLDLKISGLTIDRRNVMVFPNGMYDTEGRHLNGVIGRDVIADSMVFGFDRDQGIATLSTTKAFQPPPDALAVHYEVVSSRSSEFIASRAAVGGERNAGDSLPRGGTDVPPPVRTAADLSRIDRNNYEREHASSRPRDYGDVTPIPRRLARAQIGDATFMMHLDLGAVTSQLPGAKWVAAKLLPVDAKVRLVDEAASAREVDKAGIAAAVAIGGAKADQVAFVPFVDQRWKTEGVEGALGLDFFQPFAVHAHWDRNTYYLKPRGGAAALTGARLGRWGAELPACPHQACITAELVASNGTVGLKVVRDAAATNRPLEVYLGVTPANGTLAPLVVELSSGVDQLIAGIPPAYAGAKLEVLDVSPFPRACVGDRGCVAMISGPLAGAIELSPISGPVGPSQPASEPASKAGGGPATVPIDKLHRVTGEPVIRPSDDVQRAAGGKALAVAIVRVCLGADGKVESTKLVKASGVPAYDDQLQSTIKATWTFEPVEIDGAPAAVCTQVTFLTH